MSSERKRKKRGLKISSGDLLGTVVGHERRLWSSKGLGW